MLERDTGNINTIQWPLFRSLCQQRFGPPLCANHLADLARLPFRGSVAEYQGMFQARMAHAGYLSPIQQVQPFTGGLPDLHRTDVELQAPTNLQQAMSLVRAYERRATSYQAMPSHQQRLPPRAALAPPSLSSTIAAATPSIPAPPRPFKRLTPAEMTEHRRQGLCYNCDEPYVRGHKCQRLFYLEVSDFDDQAQQSEDDQPTEDMPPLFSLHALTGIRQADTMQVKVRMGNHQISSVVQQLSILALTSPTAVVSM
jgi:hypothetical protein